MDLDKAFERIEKVLEDVEEGNYRDYIGALDAWQSHLEENLSFPFEAEVYKESNVGPLETGDEVRVIEVFNSTNIYGIIAELEKGKDNYQLPLCELEVEEGTPNYQFVKDYKIWFANY